MSIIEFESARNAAMDRYFNARPAIIRDKEGERLFEAGFRMAWEVKSVNQQTEGE